ncbi:magnesium and cobalt transport protein CorA [Alcaligenes sp. SORT26]|uniref:magnesium and cobalt transport protein CorA n=1 Tax=Alcaligenes sp. SORT26 TaxID=2813780 RepID=UPI001A9E0EC8|nr:magnesium and cobalt transport protein CorA [Alcaligenes sp. SORT26]QTB99903.1 magnesium and cobalt transport protein CorA [Alcaligenes sp. SORT26]
MQEIAPVAPDAQDVVVAAYRYQSGQPAQALDIHHLPAHDPLKDGFIWIGLKDPSEVTLRHLGEQLGLPSNAVDELIVPHRRPKWLEFSNCLIVVAVTFGLKDLRPVFGTTQILIAQGLLLTVRRGSNSSYLQLRSRLESTPALLVRGSDFVASELLDLIVDQYQTCLEQFEKAVEAIEQQFLILGFKENDVRRIYRLRRDLLRVYNAVTPLAELSRRLSRIELAYVDAESRAYFGEVADRITRTSEFINSLRQALAFAFEGGLMIGQMQQTDTTRKLAAWAAILAVPTAVAGIYGMNFKFMPELEWTMGYPLALGLMGSVCGFLYWKFKKAKWL